MFPPNTIFLAERMRIDSKTFNFSLNFYKFSQKLLKFPIKFPKFFQIIHKLQSLTLFKIQYT